MNFQTQSLKLPVVNFDITVEEEKRTKRHGELLPDSIYAVFCSPSNCGKTNSLLAFITHPNGLRFENVYVYSKSLNQSKYRFLKELLQPINGVQYFPSSKYDEVDAPNNALPNSVIVFNDIACEKQDTVKRFSAWTGTRTWIIIIIIYLFNVMSCRIDRCH